MLYKFQSRMSSADLPEIISQRAVVRATRGRGRIATTVLATAHHTSNLSARHRKHQQQKASRLHLTNAVLAKCGTARSTIHLLNSTSCSMVLVDENGTQRDNRDCVTLALSSHCPYDGQTSSVCGILCWSSAAVACRAKRRFIPGRRVLLL